MTGTSFAKGSSGGGTLPRTFHARAIPSQAGRDDPAVSRQACDHRQRGHCSMTVSRNQGDGGLRAARVLSTVTWATEVGVSTKDGVMRPGSHSPDPSKFAILKEIDWST